MQQLSSWPLSHSLLFSSKVTKSLSAPSAQTKAFHRFVKLLALPLLSLAAPAAYAEEVAGFGTTFAPESWLVVNTNPSQSLSFPSAACNFTDVEGEGPNGVACISSYTSQDVSLLGSSVIDPLDPTSGFPAYGSGDPDNARSTTLQLHNSNWRQVLIKFSWTFYSADVDPNADPAFTPGFAPADQFVSFLVDPGWTSPNNDPDTYSFTSTVGTTYQDIAQTVYLPAGATLSFSVNTLNNNNMAGILYIKGFTTEEVPAPLPITGSSAVLLYSRRLRRRTKQASSQPPAIHPTTGKVLSLAEQHSSLQRQLALKHYGRILRGPVQSVLPISPSTNKI